MHIEVTRLDDGVVQVHLFGGAGNPLVRGAPAIDWDSSVVVDENAGTGIEAVPEVGSDRRSAGSPERP
jgi:hypothetical protein